MYNFKDIDSKESSTLLLSEYLKYDGIILEQIIPGYTTLSIEGRELFSPEIMTKEITGVDGSHYYGRRYPARTIRVKYQLIANTPEEFRDAFNKLNACLSKENVQVIFGDEPDKYFVGSKVGNDNVPEGHKSIVSSFEIYCPDPFKYATTIKEVSAVKNVNGIYEATIDNKGNYELLPEFEIRHKGETGYLSIISQNGVMQFGTLEKPSEHTEERAVMLADYKQASDMSNMILNDGCINLVQNGTTTSAEGKYLSLDDIGTGDWWHGASRTFTIVTPTNNLTVNSKIWFETYLISQKGMIQIAIGDEEKKRLCAIHLQKYNPSNNIADIYMQTDSVTKQLNFEPSYTSITNQDKGNISITFNKGYIDFLIQGEKYSMYDPTLVSKKAKYVTIYLAQIGATNNRSHDLVSRLYVKTLQIIDNRTNTFTTIPNRYHAGDVCTVLNGKYYVNGVYTPQDEILGTKYFKVSPGQSKIQFGDSLWSNSDMEITVRYRERWL